LQHHKTAPSQLFLACLLTLMLVGTLCPATAHADSSSEIERLRQQANQMSAKIEQSTVAYQMALAEVESLKEMIADNEARTAEIEAKLPEQRSRTASSIRALYIFQQSSPGLLGLILSAENFNDFITTLRYIDTIHERNTNEINQLASLDDELKSTQAELSLEYEVAAQKQDEALNALEEARSAKRELQQRADAIAAEEAKSRAEAVAKARAAIDAAKTQEPKATSEQKPAQEPAPQAAQPTSEAQPAQQQEQPKVAEPKAEEPKVEEPAAQEQETPQATFTTSSGHTAVVEVPEVEETSVSTEPITSNTTVEESDGWAARIDAYLAGSPLAGYGSTFAAAAATYGVDPRFSPAISCVESGKGAVCFLPHNAWGWGSSSWPDWETAIYDHVAGLASGYGGTLTLEGAMRYCPPTYQEWYSSVLAEMNSI